MLKLSRLLALLAAIMLVIGGAPAVAATQPCDPCPPDCAMMQQMAAAQADHHAKAPDKGKAENPCKHAVVCQAPATAVPAAGARVVAALAMATVDHRPSSDRAAPSRPPDRSLRPPIQL